MNTRFEQAIVLVHIQHSAINHGLQTRTCYAPTEQVSFLISVQGLSSTKKKCKILYQIAAEWSLMHSWHTQRECKWKCCSPHFLLDTNKYFNSTFYDVSDNSRWQSYLTLLPPPISLTSTLWSELGWEERRDWPKDMQSAFMPKVEFTGCNNWFSACTLHAHQTRASAHAQDNQKLPSAEPRVSKTVEA